MLLIKSPLNRHLKGTLAAGALARIVPKLLQMMPKLQNVTIQGKHNI